MILDSHSSYFISQFDRICAENNIIPHYIPIYFLYLLQPLDIGYFALFKCVYNRFVSDLAHIGYNYIDKLDFLADYSQIYIETFQPETIQNSFTATGLTPINLERILSKLNISLRTPTPPESRSSSRSSQFIPKTSKTVIQLQKQTRLLKGLLKQRSNSPPSPSKTAVDQIIKGTYISMHNAAILAQENTVLRHANKKKCQKRTRSNRQIVHKGDLSIAEDLQLAQQLNQPVEDSLVVSHKTGKSVSQADLPRRRAPPRCSGCGEIGHKINRCKNS